MKYVLSVFGALVGIALVATLFHGCHGFVNPFEVADEAFVKALAADVDVLHKKIHLLEERVEKAALDTLRSDLEELRKLTCDCDKDNMCNCDSNKKPQWYHSLQFPNIYLYGTVRDNELFYTWVYDRNTGLVTPATPLVGGKKQPSNRSTKDFDKSPVVALPGK